MARPSVHATAASGQPRSRIGRVLGYDGVISALLRATAGHFVSSLGFLACLAPFLVFQALVGWQPTHLSIWLGALALVPVFPAVSGLFASVAELRALGVDAQAWRVYWRGFAEAARHLWWMSVGTALVVVLIGYDLALLAASDVVFLLAMAAILVTTVVVVAVAVVARDGAPSRRPPAVLATALGRVIRRPHVALVWLVIIGLTGAATAVPIAGSLAWLFGPALAARLVLVCNDALGFTPTGRTEVPPAHRA